MLIEINCAAAVFRKGVSHQPVRREQKSPSALVLSNISMARSRRGPQYTPDSAFCMATRALCVLPLLVGPPW